jgi:integrase
VADQGPTFAEVAEAFLAHIERRRKRPDEVRRSLEKELLPALGERPVRTITSKDIRLVVEAVVKRGSPTQAGKVLAHAKQLFRFACGRDDVAVSANPAYPLEADALGVEHNVCQRYLSAEEITLFLKALDAARLSPTVKLGLKVILHTGVRTCELLRARWSDVDLDAGSWTVPVASQKLTKKQEQTARPWTVPLTGPVVELFSQLRVLAQGSEWVLASPFDFEAVLSEKALVAGMRKLFEAPKGKEPLLTFTGPRPTPHDLRRTVRTHLGDTLGVPWHIAERCLNHSIGRITHTYDVGDYMRERRDALEKWTAYLVHLISPNKAKVAFLVVGRP